MVLFWVIDGDQRRRMSAYAVALGGGTALGFLLFASYANRAAGLRRACRRCGCRMRCWAARCCSVLALLSPADWKRRLALAAGGGIAGRRASTSLPGRNACTRLEGVSPEVVDLWLSHVREARPIYRHGWRTVLAIVSLPVTGLIGWLLLVWFNRRDRRQAAADLGCDAAAGSPQCSCCLWQTRTGPAAQMLSATGATALSLDQRSLGPEIEECRAAGFRHGRARSARHGRGSTASRAISFRRKRRRPRCEPSTRRTACARRYGD